MKDYYIIMERAKMGTETPTRLQGVIVSDRAWGHGTLKALQIDVPIDAGKPHNAEQSAERKDAR